MICFSFLFLFLFFFRWGREKYSKGREVGGEGEGSGGDGEGSGGKGEGSGDWGPPCPPPQTYTLCGPREGLLTQSILTHWIIIGRRHCAESRLCVRLFSCHLTEGIVRNRGFVCIYFLVTLHCLADLKDDYFRVMRENDYLRPKLIMTNKMKKSR